MNMKSDNNDKIICDTCIANSVKGHCPGKEEHKGKCISCSMYYEDPKTTKGYIKYYWRNFKNRIYGFKYRIKDKFNWWKFNNLNKGVPSCVSSGDIIEVVDSETGETRKYKVNSAWIDYDRNKPGFVVMSSVSTIDNPKGSSISTMDTNLWLNLDSHKYHVVSINRDNKLIYDYYRHEWV